MALARTVSGSIQDAPYHPTPSLDPRNVSAMEGYEDHRGYVSVAFDAFNVAFDGLTNLGKAREQVKRDPSKTEANQILLVAGEASKLQDRITRSFDHAHKTLTAGVAHTESILNAPLVARADTTLGREVRELVRGMKNDERQTYLRDALQNKDHDVLESVLGAHHSLAGLTRELRAHWTRQYHEASKPELAARLQAQRKALSLVERGPLVFAEIKRVLGVDWDTVGKLRQASSEADKALLLVNSAAPTT